MKTMAEAFVVGRDVEVMWNREQGTLGYTFLELPVPPLRYRLFRGLHCAQMQARENAAIFIASWLEPPKLP